MIIQKEIKLKEKPRGVHLVTDEIMSHLGELPDQGMLHLFVKHTSAGITLNENADPSVRTDFERFMNDLVPEDYDFDHTSEGSDDMPAHIKTAIFGNSVCIPITNGRLNTGTWQGIYLGEFRDHGGSRKILATVYS
ncbi:MAG: secondary thiamine-phosphate synthase enzyme YjbQ [Bacteroidota bacterium]